MHMLIRVIVPAEDEDEALEKGKEIGDRLTEGPNGISDFDYYKSLDHEPGEHRVAGADRWGHDIPAVTPLDSEQGEELVEEGWESTQKRFKKGLENCRTVIQHLSDEEIREEEYDALPEQAKEEIGSPFDVRGCFQRVAGYTSAYNFLYNRHGNPIRRRTELENLKTSVKQTSDVDLWVIPLDVHH